MQFSKRTSYLNDEDIIDELINNEKTIKSRKKISDIICSNLNYFSLVPSLIYNATWIFVIKSALEKMGSEEPSLEKAIEGCSEIYNWAHYTLTWTIISFLKALFLLFCVKMCIGEGDDCNIICLAIKIITSVVPSLIFVFKLPLYVNNYNLFNKNSIDLEVAGGNMSQMDGLKFSCDQLANNLNIFYRWEYAYVIFILFIFCGIPAGAICMCLKEAWKSRGYTKCD